MQSRRRPPRPVRHSSCRAALALPRPAHDAGAAIAALGGALVAAAPVTGRDCGQSRSGCACRPGQPYLDGGLAGRPRRQAQHPLARWGHVHAVPAAGVSGRWAGLSCSADRGWAVLPQLLQPAASPLSPPAHRLDSSWGAVQAVAAHRGSRASTACIWLAGLATGRQAGRDAQCKRSRHDAGCSHAALTLAAGDCNTRGRMEARQGRR